LKKKTSEEIRAVSKLKKENDKAWLKNMQRQTVPRKRKRVSRGILESATQTTLDLGQKLVSSEPCKICGMLYSRGIEEDEKKHRVYHSNFTEGVKWGSVKKCEMSSGRVDFLNGRIVRISPHYSTKALDDVVNFLNRTFGGEEDLEGEHALFLWILKKRVRGVLLCETISTAHRVLSDPSDMFVKKKRRSQIEMQSSFMTAWLKHKKQINATMKTKHLESIQEYGSDDLCSLQFCEKKVPCKVGVSKIWIHPKLRKKGAALKMMEMMSESLHVSPNDVAFLHINSGGKYLARRFCERTDFLVY